MNKQRYLAELRRLLVFMTEEDRDLTVRHFTGLFDEAGPEGEQALILALGTPTKAAIRLSRGYEPGSVSLPQPAQNRQPAPEPPPAQRPQPAPGTQPAAVRQPLPAPKAAPEERDPKTDDDFWRDLLGFDMPELSTPAPEPEEEAELPPPGSVRAAYPDGPSTGPGAAVFVLLLIVPGIPAAALFLAAMAVCAAPGCGLIFGAYLAAVGGLWCLAHIADAILMFGLAFLILGLGLLVLWLGIRLDVRLVRVYARGVRWAYNALMGRRSTDDETR